MFANFFQSFFRNVRNILPICFFNIFAKFFQSVFSTDDGILPIMNKTISSCLIFDKHDIATRLQTFPFNYPCEPNEIPTAFLKTLHNVIAFSLCLIFQHSFSSGILPNA